MICLVRRLLIFGAVAFIFNRISELCTHCVALCNILDRMLLFCILFSILYFSLHTFVRSKYKFDRFSVFWVSKAALAGLMTCSLGLGWLQPLCCTLTFLFILGAYSRTVKYCTFALESCGNHHQSAYSNTSRNHTLRCHVQTCFCDVDAVASIMLWCRA